ncbi:MAG: hypothetical protein LBG95_10160 [Treponema sp.]|jgi:hypothetical protein|nr:hypothetical protein [Treponema sp.]
MNDKNNLADDEIGKWIDGYLCGQMNASAFTILILLRQIIEMGISRFITGTFGFISNNISKRHLTPKEEQQATVLIKEMIKVQNDNEMSSAEKDQQINELEEKLENFFVLLIGKPKNDW